MMRKLAYIVLLFSAVSCSDAPDSDVAARDRTEADTETDADRTPPETDWTGEFDRISAELGLSDDEEANLKATFEARTEALIQWWDEKGAELPRFERRMKRAAKARDLKEFRAAKAKAEPLIKELRDLLKTHRSNIREALSPEHRIEWEAHQLSERILELMQPLKLSDRQIAQVRAESVSAVRANVNEPNPTAAAYMKLEQTVERDVLTAEQRESFQEIKKQHPLRSLKTSLAGLATPGDTRRS